MFLKFPFVYLCLIRYLLKTQSLHNKRKIPPFDSRKAVSKKGRNFKTAFFCKYIDGLSQFMVWYGLLYLYFSNDHSEPEYVENLEDLPPANDLLLGNAP